MVRVISVHHFQGQNVETVEQPTACTVAPPDLLLLAMTTNSIEVRDLKQKHEEIHNGSVLFTFPTVDEVVRMCHSINGDYVATIESRVKQKNCARVYLNWNGVATLQQSKMTSKGACLGAASECGMVQPMRARIAGRVTPPTNSGRGEAGPCLEMIELEDDSIDGYNPELIICCPITGNLCISTSSSVTIYRFLVKTHDISRLKFVDFECSNLTFQLKFAPKQVELRENYLLIMNNLNVNLVKLVVGDSSEEKNKKRKKKKCDEDYTNLLNNSNTTIDFAKLANEDVVLLPSILEKNCLIRRHNALINFEKLIKIVHNEDIVRNLVNLSVDEGEEFRCCVIKPYYLNNEEKEENCYKQWLRSKYKMSGIAFIVATQQEAFLYYFNDIDDELINTEQLNCIAVYNTTAPIYSLVLEDYFLHSLTETGLETYTLRIAHELCRNQKQICPPITEPICLVGLRPFLGVEKLLASDAYLILLANCDASPTHSVASNSSSNAAYWTLYALELPSAVTCFTDINATAQAHRFTSMQTYRHLLNEAHMILRAALLAPQFAGLTQDGVVLASRRRCNYDDVIETFRLSCALLADHFLLCHNYEEYSLSVFYYNTAGVRPDDVIRRAKKLQEQSNIQVTQGLVHYLKTWILENKVETWKFTSNFLDEFLKIFTQHAIHELPEILLKSPIIREFSAEKLIEILENTQDDETTSSADRRKMALCALYARKNDFNNAATFLRAIDDLRIFTQFPDVLFEKNARKFVGFSDVATLLAAYFPQEFTAFLVELIADPSNNLNLGRVIKIFLDYLPSSGDQTAATSLMQIFLEKYFRRNFAQEDDFPAKFASEKSAPEALKLLTRTYLAQLQIFKMKNNENEEIEEENEVVFPEKFRYRYLDKMPPFQIEITRKIRDKLVENPENSIEPNQRNKNADGVLVKLQTLLCLPVTSRALRAEVHAFLTLNSSLSGADAIHSLIIERRDAVEFLTQQCPQCLPQFAKDRLSQPEDIRFLIENLQRKLRDEKTPAPVLFFYEKTLKDVLMGVATSTTPDEFTKILEQSVENYEEYATVCRETTHAQQIKKLINATGQQLLCTLNL